MTIKEWAVEFRSVSAAHGFESKVTPENPAMFSEKMLLVVSEISEALEEFRSGKGLTETYYKADKPFKPEGIPIEIADAVIRIFEFCESNGIDLEAALELKNNYNKTRPYKHGKAF